MTAKHIIVEGKVQGVGFRNFVKKTADSLGGFGWVRNLWDGRVELVIAGMEPEVFQKFEQAVRQGPLRSIVNRVTINEIGEISLKNEFEIQPDGREPWQK